LISQAELDFIWPNTGTIQSYSSSKLWRQARSLHISQAKSCQETKSDNNNSVTVHYGDTKKKTKHNNPA